MACNAFPVALLIKPKEINLSVNGFNLPNIKYRAAKYIKEQKDKYFFSWETQTSFNHNLNLRDRRKIRTSR